MRAGELRHRLTLQEKTITRSASGAEIETWADLTTFWGSVEPVKGREYFQAQQVNVELTARIRIRYRFDIKPEMRVKVGTRLFDIKSVINVGERDRELELMCVEVVA